MKQLIDWTLYEVCYNILFAFFVCFQALSSYLSFWIFLVQRPSIASFIAKGIHHCQYCPCGICVDPLAENYWWNLLIPTSGFLQQALKKSRKKKNTIQCLGNQLRTCLSRGHIQSRTKITWHGNTCSKQNFVMR